MKRKQEPAEKEINKFKLQIHESKKMNLSNNSLEFDKYLKEFMDSRIEITQKITNKITVGLIYRSFKDFLKTKGETNFPKYIQPTYAPSTFRDKLEQLGYQLTNMHKLE